MNKYDSIFINKAIDDVIRELAIVQKERDRLIGVFKQMTITKQKIESKNKVEFYNCGEF